MLTLLLSRRLASRATHKHRRWRMHPVPFRPSIFLTLPFHSELIFQIPQVKIPHPNFPSHPNLRTLTHLSRTPKEIRRPVTGYRAPVRIRSAAWSSASPDGREVGRLAAVHPIVGLLLACASRTSVQEQQHPHPGGAHRGHGQRRRPAASSRGSCVPPRSRIAPSCALLAHLCIRSSSLRQELIIACGHLLYLRSFFCTVLAVRIVGTVSRTCRDISRRSRTPSRSRSNSS